MIIVIDGPAGSGKSSTAKAVAQKMRIEYLDSGALYRALTWFYIKCGKDKKAFFDALEHTSISFSYAPDVFRVIINGNDINNRLRTNAVAELVSEVASFPRSRSFVNALMQEAVLHGQYIAEGRDLGTAVFPNAEVKFFMVADVDERARRRFKELASAGTHITFDEVRQNIRQRDAQDSSRANDPLKKADDAVEINTTNLDFEEQVERICSIIGNQTELTYK